MFDTHLNFAIGTILTPPSPADTGNTFLLMPGHGEHFQANMPVTIVPRDTQPTADTAEIGYVTEVDGDLLVVTRAQEGTTAKTPEAGWLVIGSITAKTVTDLEEAIQNAATVGELAAHITDTDNPHSVTKAQLGLGNVDNTSDVDKPVSTAVQALLNGKVSKSGDTMSGSLIVQGSEGQNIVAFKTNGGTNAFVVNSSSSAQTSNVYPLSNLVFSLGLSIAYYSELYARRHYLNSTAYIDGSVPGRIDVTGSLRLTDVTTNAVSSATTSTVLRLSGGTVDDGAVLVMGGSMHSSIPNRASARVGVTEIFSWSPAGVAFGRQINLASITAPTSPSNGDIWFDGTNLKMRVGGVTKTITMT